MKIKDFIRDLLELTGADVPEERSCDKLILGDPEAEVKKIVTTFMVTLPVLQKAAELGANLIISHEPTLFFEMRRLMFKEKDDFSENNPVYLAMKELLEKHQIAIFRFHDHMHAEAKDGIYRSLEKEIDWEELIMPPKMHSSYNHFGGCYEYPEMTLRELAELVKEKFHMDGLRIVGDPEMKVSRVGLLVGGGSQGLGDPFSPIKIMEERDLHVIICGEIHELLTPPFIRNMEALGYRRAMIIIGHERSEEFGMKYLGEWMAPILQGTEVVFLDSGDPFSYL